jgi:hypothetical protein
MKKMPKTSCGPFASKPYQFDQAETKEAPA